MCPACHVRRAQPGCQWPGKKPDNTCLDETQQAQAHRIFTQLVRPGAGTEDTRRRVLREELEALDVAPEVNMSRIIDTFDQYRLLTFDRDPLTRGPTVEVAHEAVLSRWDRLRGWIDHHDHDEHGHGEPIAVNEVPIQEAHDSPKHGVDDSANRHANP